MTVPSSKSGSAWFINVTVPVIAWVEEFPNENGEPLVLIEVTQLLLPVQLTTGTPEMTAVA